MICPNCGVDHDVEYLGPVCANCGMPVIYEEPPPLAPQQSAPTDGFAEGTGEAVWEEEPEWSPAAPERVSAPEPTGPEASMPANCPHCGTPHLASQGRFCDSCGMSVITYVRGRARAVRDADDPAGEDEVVKVRCRYCGVLAPPPICPACGTHLPYPGED